MGRVTLNEDYLLATANAIRAKNGSSDTYTPAEFADAIADISGGGGGGSGSSSDDVKFIDYDGTVIYSYSASDFLALTELPANPTHTGLVPQGWNWSLVDAKTHVSDYGKLIIGQIYTTTSGKTEIDIYFPPNCKRLTPCLSLGINGEVDIDWGDGSAHTVETGTSTSTKKDIIHEYTYPGNYTILIDVTNGTACPLSTNSNMSFFNGNISSSTFNNYVYFNEVQAIRIGNNFIIRTYSFSNCYSLSSITIPNGAMSTMPTYLFSGCSSLSSISIPNGVTQIGNSAFYNCFSLSSISIPNGVTSLGSSVFNACYSLSSITIPTGITSIPATAFQYNYSLSIIIIPSGVTSIGNNAFQYCYGVKEYHLLPTTPPTLASTTLFNGIPSDCIIYVPQGTLEAYQTATNWSTYASYMQEQPST